LIKNFNSHSVFSIEATEFDPYQAAMVIHEQVIEFLQQRGELLRPSQISSEEEQENHFDALARLYKETLLFLGLDWPPPASDELTENTAPK
jgi:hypothetical protein